MLYLVYLIYCSITCKIRLNVRSSHAWAAVMQWCMGDISKKISILHTYIHTYIHRLYLKHGKPSVILHNKYSLNYCKLKKIYMNSHSKYIKYNKYETTVLPGCRVGVRQELN